jgi:hypothetical protein
MTLSQTLKDQELLISKNEKGNNAMTNDHLNLKESKCTA